MRLIEIESLSSMIFKNIDPVSKICCFISEVYEKDLDVSGMQSFLKQTMYTNTVSDPIRPLAIRFV